MSAFLGSLIELHALENESRLGDLLRLLNKAVLLTGATGGIGSEIAKLFAAEGARLVLNGRDPDRGELLAEALRAQGAEVAFVAGDVGEERTAQALAAVAEEKFGYLDVLVLNAGTLIESRGKFWEVSLKDFDRAFRTNVRSVWLVVRASLPLLRPQASVIVVGSIGSSVVMEDEMVYCATKAAVCHLARGMALDLAQREIRVNVLSPGYIDAGMTHVLLKAAADPTPLEQSWHAAPPVGRMGYPTEVARAALFLATAESSYCTGANLVVDGGLTLVAR